MADEFKIVASLNIPESASRINKDIPKLEGQAKHLKIVADLNPTLSIKNIQATLNKMNNNTNIKIGIDTSGLNSVQGATQNITNGLKNVQTQAQQTASAVKQVGTSLLSLKAEQLRNITFDIGADDDGYFSFQKTLDNARKAINEIGKFKSISFDWNLDKDSGEIKNLTATITDSNNIIQNFTYNLEKLGQAFSYVGGSGNTNGVKKLLSDIEKANATAQKKLAEFNNKSMGLFNKTDVYAKALEASKNITDYDSIAKFNNAMAELEAHYQKITAYTRSGSKSLNPFINAVNDMAGMEEQIKRIKASADGLQNKSKSLIGNLGSLNRLAANVNKHAVGTEEWGQAYEKLKNKIAQVNDQIKTAKVEQKTTDSFAQKQQNMYSVIEQRMKQINQLKIQQLSTDESTSRIIQEQINSYTNQINGIKGNMSKYKYGDKTLDNEVEKLKVELDYKYRIAQSEKENRVQQQSNNELLKFQTDTLREINAEYEKIIANKKAMASTKSEENKSIYANRIAESEKIIANDMEMLKDANLLTEEINQQVASKRQYVSEQEKIIANTEQIKREQELNQVFKSQITEVEKYKNTINEIIGTLQNLQNSKTFTNNASNSQVTETRNKITALIAEYQKLLTQLDGKVTPTTLENLNAELTQLNACFNDATTTAKRFETELINDNGAEQLAQKVKLLNERIKAYQSANPKAAKAFSQEFSDMSKTLSNPNIDLSSYNSVAKQLQIIKVRANEANLAGKTMWATFKEKLAKFTGWMSMTAAVSMFTRSIRDALDELKEVDTILTEISKTSDRTEESLRKLGETSFATASKYGQKASDYLLGVQEMSRAGFDENSSEQMAELSTLAQSAGDMTAELANEYLIATNAGYQFGGSAEKLNAVLNSQNYITNRNALNMSELAEATKIVASQAAQSGIGIDEMTAAVGTMIATTQQGGEVAARALKGILMNLQAVKGTAEDIGDGGEDITDESLTKYEEACVDLGVALKEVKNGVLQLRDPMVILEELANAVSKEAEGSIKVANLVSAIGGKYRGGQLLSLLRNWDTYSKMLSEFNSNEAVGSAFDEAMKSAESWEGKLNELSNTWTDFVNGLVTSDTAKSVIDFLTTIIKNIDKLRDSIGTIPTLLGSIATASAFKNVGGLINTPPYAPLQLCA